MHVVDFNWILFTSGINFVYVYIRVYLCVGLCVCTPAYGQVCGGQSMTIFSFLFLR